MRQSGLVSATFIAVLVPAMFGMTTDARAQDTNGAPVRVSAASPFTADCNGPDFPITATYVNAENEPYVAINPRDPDNLIAVYHVDRFPNDGANGVLAASSFDGGRTWQIPDLGDQPPFSRCAGGNESNGGDFEKSSDPWVEFGPDGTAYFAALSTRLMNTRRRWSGSAATTRSCGSTETATSALSLVVCVISSSSSTTGTGRIVTGIV